MMAITGKTRLCALIGDPVEHTMSPAMHNAAFKKLGLDYIYLPFNVKPGALAAAVAGFRALGARGFNITIPHKVNIIPMLDSLDPLAERIHAVNTVVNEGGHLRGFNTDAEGFLQTLLSRGIKPEGKKILVAGAGGASRAISYILAREGARVSIANRQQELDWAADIARFIHQDLGRDVPVFDLANLAAAIDGIDVLVNATSVGMSPASAASPVPAALLRGIPAVFDIVYNPLETRLLKDARAAGALTITGVDMLVWQGVAAFEKWTGLPAPFDLMRAEAVTLLEKK